MELLGDGADTLELRTVLCGDCELLASLLLPPPLCPGGERDGRPMMGPKKAEFATLRNSFSNLQESVVNSAVRGAKLT